jgi:beta-lactamase regulating signal transducer with metallopeptidase domain
MMAVWMLYATVSALGLGAAAALVERLLLRGRAPVRWAWVASVAASLTIPVVAFLGAPSIASSPTPAPIARVDQPLAVAWSVLSTLAGVHVLGGLAALAVMRRRWRERDVLGVRVLVSERTGPALLGAIAPAIVVPEWTLAMDDSRLALVLRHELEHRHAGDGRLLAIAQLALVAMPWNLGLWWQLARLRAAVEMDCDARVLRDADPRTYGTLLLDLVQPTRGLDLLGVRAFADRAAQLDRRIRAMTERGRVLRGARVLASCVALAATAIAWVAPRPAAQPTVAHLGQSCALPTPSTARSSTSETPR